MAGHGRRALGVLTGVLAGAFFLGPGLAFAGQASVRFAQVGSFSFVVPAGVTQIHIDAIGGRGGNAGGFGEELVGNLAVVPGAALVVGVGLGGGEGGPGAGDGGGLSEVRTATLPTQRHLVAAGGGGAGGGSAGGGGTGGAAGAPGANGSTVSHGSGAGAGTMGAGGAGGSGAPGAAAGSAGGPLQGGAGAGAATPGVGGGGGGGGIYGGGGGGATAAGSQAAGGGGGGASLVSGVTAQFRATSVLAQPSVTIAYEESVTPVVSLAAPALRVAGTPALTGTASTGGGDDTAVTVRIYPGLVASGTPARTITAIVGAGGAYSAPTTGLADGTWTARTTLEDAAGNAGQSAVRTFTLDTTAPALALTAPGDGVLTASRTLVFAGNAGTAVGDAGSVALQLYAGPSIAGTPVRSVAAPVTSGAFGLTVAGLGDGTYTLVARQSDDLRNVGASAPRSFTVDTIAPSVTISAPAPGAVVRQGAGAVATFACADERSGLESCASTVASGAALDTATLGARELVVSARDRAGNVRVERRAYIVVVRAAGVNGAGTLPDGGLGVGTARAERKGRVLTVTLIGTVVPAATGRVTVTAKDIKGTGRRLRATIRQGRWRATLRIRLSGSTRPARVRVTIAYSGDKTHRATTFDRRLTVVRRL